jgi:hypothetical protein
MRNIVRAEEGRETGEKSSSGFDKTIHNFMN